MSKSLLSKSQILSCKLGNNHTFENQNSNCCSKQRWAFSASNNGWTKNVQVMLKLHPMARINVSQVCFCNTTDKLKLVPTLTDRNGLTQTMVVHLLGLLSAVMSQISCRNVNCHFFLSTALLKLDQLNPKHNQADQRRSMHQAEFPWVIGTSSQT